ncbi:MAG: DUF4157 domain-containing protein [Bacteroidota bacterium]
METHSQPKPSRQHHIEQKSAPPTFFGQQADPPTAFFQPKLHIHPAHDPYEAEADAVADQIVAGKGQETISANVGEGASVQGKSIAEGISQINPSAAPAMKQGFSGKSENPSSTEQEQTAVEEDIQAKGDPVTPPKDFEQQLNNSKGGGDTMPHETQSRMEQGFGSDFSQVRVHTGSQAVQMSQSIGAEAFTHGSDIYFNEGKYQPGTSSGDHLLAHELTHTVQQGGVQRKAAFEDVQASFIRDLIDSMVSLAGKIGIDVPSIVDNIPGYSLFSYITEFDLIRNRAVERNGKTLIKGLMGIIPGGNMLYNKLDEYGLIDEAFQWLESQLGTIGLSLSSLEKALEDAWEDMGLTLGISGNLRVLYNKFKPLFDRVVSFAKSAVQKLLELVKKGLLKPLVAYLEKNSEAYKLATKVIGSKFPLEDKVEATTEQILKDFLLLIGKKKEVEEMEKKGTLKKTADWIDKNLGRFTSLLGRFQLILTKALDALSLESLGDMMGVFSGIWEELKILLQDFYDFASEVAAEVLKLIKEALLNALDSFANNIPGYHLLTVIIQKNPFTGKKVKRSTENVIRGFMGLVPGGEAKFQELKKTGVIGKAVARIEALVKELAMSPAMVVQLFTDIWNSLSIDDLIEPFAAFQRIVDQFGVPISRLFDFVVKMVQIVVELILQMMGIPPELIQSILANAMQAFQDIKNNPLGFLINLIKAIGLGFKKFFDNFLKHLLGGLQAWLFAQLKKAGIEPPKDLSVKNLLGMAMNIFGITIENLFARLEKKIGKEKVDKIRKVISTVQGAFDFIREFNEKGPEALFDRIKDQISNLWTIITDGIKNFVMEKVIQKVMVKILSSLEPTGIMAAINGAMAFFDAVRTFVERFKEILQIINNFTLGLVNIAKGSLNQAAEFLEKALAKGLPVAIDFLAKQAGLDDLGQKIAVMIGKAREKINMAIDWLIDKVLQGGKALLNLGKAGLAKLMQWWKTKVPVTTLNKEGKKESHKIRFDGAKGKRKLILNPRSIDILEYIDMMGPAGAIQDYENVRREVAKQLEKISYIAYREDQAERVPGRSGVMEDAGLEISQRMKAIARLIGLNSAAARPVPGSVVSFDQNTVTGFISMNPGSLIGTRPIGLSAETQALRRVQSGSPYHFNTYQRGHKLGKQFFGEGYPRNLMLISERFNNQVMRDDIEERVSNVVFGQNRMVRYTISPAFRSNPERNYLNSLPDLPNKAGILSHLPSHITFEAVTIAAGRNSDGNIDTSQYSISGSVISRVEIPTTST